MQASGVVCYCGEREDGMALSEEEKVREAARIRRRWIAFAVISLMVWGVTIGLALWWRSVHGPL